VGILQAAVLGVVQGLTEFLPISSDGHLAVAYRLLGERPDLTFEVFLHAATLIAMVIYFRADIVNLLSSLLPKNSARTEERRLVGFIVVATGVSGVLALALSPFIEELSNSITWVGLGFLLTAALLAIGERFSKSETAGGTDRLRLPGVGFIGVLQGLAVLPGVSRSGSTIVAGMLSGLSREQAARFSFLLGIPIIALAAAKDAVDLFAGHVQLPGIVPSVVGFAAAGVTGYLAIALLLSIVKRHKLYWFAAYTAVLGTAMLLMDTVFARG
jgi:undecaprenyl-diphosphatase